MKDQNIKRIETSRAKGYEFFEDLVREKARGFIQEILEELDRVHATGYTIFHNISGKGHHGTHAAHPMFNEMDSLVMVMTVVPEETVEPVLAGLHPLFDRYPGVMFVSDVAVSRRAHFAEPHR